MKEIKDWLTLVLGCLVIVALLEEVSWSAESKPESYYRDMDCYERRGEAEHRNPDGTYTDCLAGDVAIEYDFAREWYECISQAGHYALVLGEKRPLCVLIIVKPTDKKYLERAVNFKR